MKKYNTKFKSIGYEYVPENSSTSNDEWVLSEENRDKRISIIKKAIDPDDLSIIVVEKLFYNGDWHEVPPVITAKELDCIKEYISDEKSFDAIVWDEKLKVYKLGDSDGNN